MNEPDAAVAEDIRNAAAKADADAATATQMDTFVAETDSAMAAEEAEPADEANLAADGTAQPATPPAAADVKPADITAELAQQSVEARPSIPSSGPFCLQPAQHALHMGCHLSWYHEIVGTVARRFLAV